MAKKSTLEKALKEAEAAFESAHDALRDAETEWLEAHEAFTAPNNAGWDSANDIKLADAIRGYRDALRALVDLDEQKDAEGRGSEA
jgi:hypothetical protein